MLQPKLDEERQQVAQANAEATHAAGLCRWPHCLERRVGLSADYDQDGDD